MLYFLTQFHELIRTDAVANSTLQLRSCTLFVPTNAAVRKYNGTILVSYHMGMYIGRDIKNSKTWLLLVNIYVPIINNYQFRMIFLIDLSLSVHLSVGCLFIYIYLFNLNETNFKMLWSNLYIGMFWSKDKRYKTFIWLFVRSFSTWRPILKISLYTFAFLIC